VWGLPAPGLRLHSFLLLQGPLVVQGHRLTPGTRQGQHGKLLGLLTGLIGSLVGHSLEFQYPQTFPAHARGTRIHGFTEHRSQTTSAHLIVRGLL